MFIFLIYTAPMLTAIVGIFTLAYVLKQMKVKHPLGAALGIGVGFLLSIFFLTTIVFSTLSQSCN